MAYKPGQGWIPDPAADEAHDKRPGVAAALQAVPLLDSKKDCFLWRYVQQNLKGTRWIRQGRLRSHNQGSTGSCVGNGGAGAAEVTAACDLLMRREAEQPHRLSDGKTVRVSPDWCYGASRHISNQLGRWDGSFGSAMAKALTDWGTIWQQPIGSHDLRKQDPSRAKEYARRGVPSDTIEVAKQHPFGEAIRITQGTSQLRQLLQAGYGVFICSQVGWSSSRRAGGWARRSGSWAHCMFVAGYRGLEPGEGIHFTDEDGGSRQEGYLIINSWGDSWNSGPIWPKDMPWGSYWCYPSDMERVLSEGASYAVSKYLGKPRAYDYDFSAADGSFSFSTAV